MINLAILGASGSIGNQTINIVNVVVTPEITQIALEDFGMSYVIRLSDGRFIVIDGGRDFEPESDKLFKALNDGRHCRSMDRICGYHR